MDNMLPKSYGVKFDFEVKTDTRSFAVVDEAAKKSGICPPEKPSMSQAFARAIAFLMRVCGASIEFPLWSPHSRWVEARPVYRMRNGHQVQTGMEEVEHNGRNPNYSLKLTQVKQLKTDAATTWRINIANRNNAGENMGHVLNAIFCPVQGLYFTEGTDKQAWLTFGTELREIITQAHARFHDNYNDEDIRRVLDAELTSMNALKIIKKTNCFIPHQAVDKAKCLYDFTKECGQVVSWLGLDNSDMTRDSLLSDLKTAIFADMDEYAAVLDAKLNKPDGERKRGEKQRERMYGTAMENIDSIMTLAEYHAQVLGVMAEGIIERRDALKAKAAEFLTRDFDAKPTLVEVQAVQHLVDSPDAAFE